MSDALWWGVLAAVILARGGPGVGNGGGQVVDYVPPPAPSPQGWPVLGSPRIWSLGDDGGSRCGLEYLPVATADWGAKILPDVGAPSAWGWSPPGDLRAAQAYGRRFIADVEFRPYVPASPGSAWAGDEIAEAAAVAALAGGVTSHGFVPKKLAPVLKVFAAAGCTGYPQVYDSDKSADPKPFLRNCLNSWRAAGFAVVRPLLGVSAGAGRLAAWLEECAEQGIGYDLYSAQRIAQMNLDCGQIVP